MNKHWISIACAALSFVTIQPLQAGPWDTLKSLFSSDEKPKPPTIKVLVVNKADAVMLEVKGKYEIHDPFTNEHIASRRNSKSNLLQPLAGGLKWGEEFPGKYQLAFIPGDAKTTIVVDGIEYKGAIYVYDVEGILSVVNEVEIEDYLSSTMVMQIEGDLQQEALAAAAISARTHAYHIAKHAKNTYWHVEAGQVGYLGYGVTQRFNGVEDAIVATRHMVLSRSGIYEGNVSPFAIAIVKAGSSSSNFADNKVQLSLAEVDKMAQQGKHAAQILSKIFPETSVQLIYGPMPYSAADKNVNDIANK